MAQGIHVVFEPGGRTAKGESGETLMELAQRVGVHINASCGGSGTCGTCKVRVVEGDVEGGFHPKLADAEVEAGYRLACQAEARGDGTVEVPLASAVDHSALGKERTARGGKVLREQDLPTLLPELQVEPMVFKVRVELEPPTKDDVLPDLDRLTVALKRHHEIYPVTANFVALRSLGPTLRRAGWEVTATLMYLGDRYRLIPVEEGDTSEENYALAVDIGTTSLAAQLLDLRECRKTEAGDCNTLAALSKYNPQISYGEDVINRILQALKPRGLETLQKAVVDGINEMIQELLGKSGVDGERVSHMVVAGNSTMTQIFLGLDPKSIREAPYVTTVSGVPVVRARDLGIALGEHLHVWCFPLVASWVGGDIVAGVLGCGMWQREDVTLYVDVGTNGEIVLGNRDWMVTTSCSAGPAFEGGGIRHGMRAARGAIEDVTLDPDSLEPSLRVIGGSKPRGICGSGLIAAAAELFQRGVLAPNGRYEEGVQSPRLRDGESGREYVITWAAEALGGEDLVLTEADLDNLIRTKAAIYAGCRVLLDSVGLSFGDVDQVIIAGGFGQSLDLEKSVAIGLLPPMPADRFLFVGNGALLGARAVSLSRAMRDQGDTLARMMTHLDLADNPAFMDQYVAAMFLPHTDTGEFEWLGSNPEAATV